MHRHLPAEYREEQTWQRVASITSAAARGQLPADDVAVALKLVLSMEAFPASDFPPLPAAVVPNRVGLVRINV